MPEQKGRVQLASGAIKPVKRRPWQPAFEKRDEAKAAIKVMTNADDRAAYEAAWINFVDAIQESWVRFYAEGKRTSTEFRAWVQQYDQHRNTKGELLCYLLQFRHKNQHDPIGLEWKGGRIRLQPKKDVPMGIRDLRVYTDGSFTVDVGEGADNELQLIHDPGEAALPVVVNRGAEFKPEMHIGEPLENISPIDAATIAIAYYEDVYTEGINHFM